MNKISKISQLVDKFSSLTDMLEGDSKNVQHVWKLLNEFKNMSNNLSSTDDEFSEFSTMLSKKISNLSEEEIEDLADFAAETGSEKQIQNYHELVEGLLEKGIEKGTISASDAEIKAELVFRKFREKLQLPSQDIEEYAKSFQNLFPENKSLQENDPSNSKYLPTALTYFNSLQALNGFVKSRSQDFNSELKSKIEKRLQDFGNALDQYDNKDQEMPMNVAQQWAEPILIPIASLIATAKQDYKTETDKLWYNIAKNSGGQIPTGFHYGTWLTMKRIPYHQATAKDVAELAKLGVKIVPGEWILSIEHIKKYPTPEQKAQMDAKKSVDRLKSETVKGVKSISDKVKQLF